MGAGKTSVGRLLADMMELPFVDLDERIVEREKSSIAQIFESRGEGYFRDCESAVLNGLQHCSATVYATGGGIVIREDNRCKMKSLGKVIYLKSTWPTLKKRLQSSADRPLVNNEKNLDDLKDLLDSRRHLYEEADVQIDTDGLTPIEVAQRIVSVCAQD